MSAQTLIKELGAAWIQFTDGSQTMSLQVFGDAVRVISSDSQPGADDEGFILEVGVWSITPPTVAWIRAHNTHSRIVYTVE
ncbi:hypothetical protein AAY84_07595 [Serratia marcescens]|uniref:hypothetical protein n=1 Tax=Serratia marcescens TaxID=615 RepID=UPI00062C4C11|nr:hypothetical protein [Serratia marcescens]KKZ19041.1 hypothetical protein AAY84_07595 [Serratia marcescens]